MDAPHVITVLLTLLVVAKIQIASGFGCDVLCLTVNRRRSRIDFHLPTSRKGVKAHSTRYSLQASSYSFDGTDGDVDDLLDFAIDSFLSGESESELSPSAQAPHPGLAPADVIHHSLHTLRSLDDPTPNHGAAVFQRFLMPLSRGERWGDSSPNRVVDPWKEILRGALTPNMLAQRIRASDFSALLDWQTLDVSDGAFDPRRDLVGNPSVAFVNAALYFGLGVEPVLIQFTLQRVGGVWLIDTARKTNIDDFNENK